MEYNPGVDNFFTKEGFSTMSSRINTNILAEPTNFSECTRIYSIANGTNTVEFLSQLKLQDSTDPNGFLGNLTALRTQLSTLPSSSRLDKEDSDIIPPYLSRIETEQIPLIRNVNNCLNEKTSLDIKRWKEQKEKTSESKDRAEFLVSPERRVSHYEGWFPLFRPMQERTLFILFGFAIASLLATTYFFLQMKGIEIKIITPESTFDMGSYKPYLIGGGILGVIGGFIAYKQGWFNKETQ